jgi:lipopolysaccharide transport system ATP-binding protein
MALSPVHFDGVWKKFRSGERHDSLRDLIPAAAKRLTRRSRPELDSAEFWALENVSFEVPQGTALGIIGPNGAGKSTILKVLTRILRPTRGLSQVKGRVGALIEIAAGFHPDLTGRENVYLQGAVMGMKRAEVTERFEAIVEFAGVGGFIDTQVKRYSSGMNARLGFSIAAHLRPDVMIIDEVLSVGDMAFQERCINRMRSFKREGIAIVFVSHNLQAVTELCDHALYLRRSVRALGVPQTVLDTYVRESFANSEHAQHSHELTVLSSTLTDGSGMETDKPVAPGQMLRLVVRLKANRSLRDLGFAFRVLRSTDQLLVYDGHFAQDELQLAIDRPQEFSVTFDFRANLTRGQYYVELQIKYNPTQQMMAILNPAGHLTVGERRTWGGVADLVVNAAASVPAQEAPVPAGSR